jgi:hypothetical protein
MLAVLAYCPKDIEQAARLAEWIEQLGGCRGHRLLLIRDTRCAGADIEAAFWRSFDGVEAIEFVDHFNSWPSAPNACFAMAARHIANTRNEPWLWLEPDVAPLRAGWLDEIEAEYRTAGKPFLGDFVSVHTPELDVPDHCSGIAVYPSPLVEYAGMALIAGATAWDVVAAPQIVPLMHRSQLLHHSWQHEPFESWDQFEREVLAFKPQCALFHADKSGSLYPLLRAKNNLSGGVESRHAIRALTEKSGAASETSGSSAPPAQSLSTPDRNQTPREANAAGVGTLTVDIFIKSYPPDYDWLRYCLRSIDRFCSGFRKVVVVSPETFNADPALKIPVQVVVAPQQCQDGYLDQQLFKLNAHQFSDADMILHVDSDTIFTVQVTPQTYLEAV